MENFFREESNVIKEKLRPAMISGDLEKIFHEYGLLRLRIADAIKQSLPQTEDYLKEVIGLQAQMNAAIDWRMRDAVRAMIEYRTEAIEQAARRDSLTGLQNRGAFDARLRSELDRARRYHRRLSLVLLDIDRLKSVNDRHGHMAGDEVLVNVARILTSSLRRSDEVFRIGGDEFAALCPETTRDAATSVMQRLEKMIRLWANEKQFANTVGISWGLASFPDQTCGNEIDEYELIRIADEQLYLCKNVHHKQLAAQR